jgi:hypothetical protein
MRAVIEGKRYDTETATEVASVENGHNVSDFHYFTEALYRTARGNWFLAGWGNARSPYATRCGNMSGLGEHLITLAPSEAQEWLEEHGKVDAVEAYFGELIEDA